MTCPGYAWKPFGCTSRAGGAGGSGALSAGGAGERGEVVVNARDKKSIMSWSLVVLTGGSGSVRANALFGKGLKPAEDVPCAEIEVDVDKASALPVCEF